MKGLSPDRVLAAVTDLMTIPNPASVPKPGPGSGHERRAVFLDRDGTIVEECGYLDRLEPVDAVPVDGDALRLLKRAGFATVVITNQAAVGRGIIEEDFVHAVHREIDRRLEHGASIDRYYYCPHFAESKIERYRQECRCRKPAPA